MLHQGYSAKEKREDGPPPSCECHDRPMRWNRRADLKAGGYWRCNLRYAEGQKRWREANRESRTRSVAWSWST